jgi:hypothetical protein
MDKRLSHEVLTKNQHGQRSLSGLGCFSEVIACDAYVSHIDNSIMGNVTSTGRPVCT